MTCNSMIGAGASTHKELASVTSLLPGCRARKGGGALPNALHNKPLYTQA